MKHALAGFLLSSLFASSVVAQADAVTLAAQQEAEERYKRLSATVEELQTTQAAQQKQITALASEISKLRDEIAHNNNNAATQDSIRKLNEQILKVDESRIADNKRIQETLEKLAKAIKEFPPAPVSGRGSGTTTEVRPPPANGGGNTRPVPTRPVPEEGFEYVIQRDDILDKIVAKYRAEKIMVTKKSIMDANPTVDWSRLKIGQKIFIPKPK
jgi:TolA-binding protein